MVWLRTITVTYMVAAIMHIPIPVFDGDNLKSGESCPANADLTADDYDVDFILLGCDPPDDSDDGPVDDDPEDGSPTAFGSAYVTSKTGSQSVFAFTVQESGVLCGNTSAGLPLNVGDVQADVAFRHFSFGKLCRNGTAHLRC